MKRTLAVLFLWIGTYGLGVLLLAGCQSFMQPNAGMSPEQLKEIVKDRNGAILCISAIGPYGTYELKNITLDSGVIRDGGLHVSDGCKTVTIDTQAPPRLVPQQPVPVVVVPAK